MLKIVFFIPFAILLLSASKAIAEQEDLSVLSRWMRWTDAKNSLYHHLADQAIELLDERAARIANLETEEQWLKRQEEVRQTLARIVGPFPEKTPLNPKIMGVLQKDGYRVEKLIYESQPDYYVTACLFIPDNLNSKTPAILNPIGHSAESFRRPIYQDVIINLVKKGFIVLTYDPISQGERLQYFDPGKGISRIGGSTSEHSYVGAQCFIAGNSIARHMIWDGIRGIDYLLTRDEVDPDRIGLTGLSGGGTLTSYIGAFDDRVYASGPQCYITSLKRLLESIGPQDGEQNLYHGIISGIDHADFLEVRAPKPALVLATTRDFFSIQGVTETCAEIKEAYKAFGKEENFGMVSDDDVHSFTTKNQEALYAFFQKHLNLPGDPTEEKVEYLTDAELTVTETGQVSTSIKGRIASDINRADAEILVKNLEESRLDITSHLKSVKQNAKKLSGFVSPDGIPEAIYTGAYQRDGYSVHKYMLEGEGDYIIPTLIMIPDGDEKHSAIIYIRPNGKAAEAGIGGEMERLVKNGYMVVAPDLIGIGEMGSGAFKGDAYIGNVSYNVWFESILIGRSIVGVWAGDIVRIKKYIESRADVNGGDISIAAYGEMCPVALHVAAFDEGVSKVALIKPLISYSSIVMNRYYNVNFLHSTVAGALTAYDLPDLVASIAPRKLLMINATDQEGNKAEKGLIKDEYAIAHSSYSLAKAKDSLSIKSLESRQVMDEISFLFGKKVMIGYVEFRTNLPGGLTENRYTNRAYVVNSDGTGRREIAPKLIEKPNMWTGFAGWSPDGSIAIISNSWESPENAAWEEENKQFRFNEDYLCDTHLIDMATGSSTNVTAVERVSNYNPGVWFWPDKPDKLGFNPLINRVAHPFIMDLDGRNKRDLTDGDAGFTYGYSASVDGKKISYHKNYQVYIANADGTDSKLIDTGNPFNFAPTWSPDGKWLLFVSGEHYDCHPHITDSNGEGLRKLADRQGYSGVVTTIDVFNFHGGSSDVPVWSRDSKWIHYSAKIGESIELMRVDLDGNIEQLTHSKPGVFNYHPVQSPDGKRWIIGSTRSGTRQLYIMSNDGGSIYQITNVKPGHGAMHPHWRPMPGK